MSRFARKRLGRATRDGGRSLLALAASCRLLDTLSSMRGINAPHALLAACAHCDRHHTMPFPQIGEEPR